MQFLLKNLTLDKFRAVQFFRTTFKSEQFQDVCSSKSLFLKRFYSIAPVSFPTRRFLHQAW